MDTAAPLDGLHLELIKEGAEARSYLGSFLGIEAVFKIRTPKSYRHPELERRLVRARIRNEARSLILARKAGLNTPRIYMALPSKGMIVMERAPGSRMSEILSKLTPERRAEVLRDAGRQLGLLHSKGMTHGDLTTSNIIVPEKGPVWFIDLSMSVREAAVEDMGVDWRLIREAFVSTHSDLPGALDHVIKGYLEQFPGGKEALDRADEIQSRGRYQVG